MELSVDFTELRLAVAKMEGLDAFLLALRKAGETYHSGLTKAKQFVIDNGGSVLDEDQDGVTVLKLFDDEAHCFQPYTDIDMFYFEI